MQEPLINATIGGKWRNASVKKMIDWLHGKYLDQLESSSEGDWSKSIVGGGGGGPEQLEMWQIKKHVTHLLLLAQNYFTHPK